MRILFAIALTLSLAMGCASTPKEGPTNEKNTGKKTEKQKQLSEKEKADALVLDVKGMQCEVNCTAKVKKTLAGMEGVEDVFVDFKEKKAYVKGDKAKMNKQAMADAVTKQGFECSCPK